MLHSQWPAGSRANCEIPALAPLQPIQRTEHRDGALPDQVFRVARSRQVERRQRVIRLDQRGAKHLRRRWGDEAARIVRSVLPGLLGKPRLVLRVENHRGHPGTSLVYFGVAADGVMYKVSAFRGSYPRPSTLHDTDRGNAEDLIANSADVVLGSLGALYGGDAEIPHLASRPPPRGCRT